MSTRLLIVDDHAGTRDLIKKFLTRPGFTFHECASGEEAVTAAREFQPHWVTMDVRMRGANGFETTKALKLVSPQSRVVILTGFNEPEFRNLAVAAGATGFILKENILALQLILENPPGAAALPDQNHFPPPAP